MVYKGKRTRNEEGLCSTIRGVCIVSASDTLLRWNSGSDVIERLEMIVLV